MEKICCESERDDSPYDSIIVVLQVKVIVLLGELERFCIWVDHNACCGKSGGGPIHIRSPTFLSRGDIYPPSPLVAAPLSITYISCTYRLDNPISNTCFSISLQIKSIITCPVNVWMFT